MKFTDLLILFLLPAIIFAQSKFENFHTVETTIDFTQKLRLWDGFGVNYVQTAHTRDYEKFPQEYGGFSLLSEVDKERILEMTFGEDGLQPGLIKMFLDPLHQKDPGSEFDHETTTVYMREFVRRGMEMTRARGGDVEIITTLYGPPPWATKQKVNRGRDLNPEYKKEVALYMIDWVKFLRDRGFPVNYLSLHNEGDDWRRWPVHGEYANFDYGHDYNLYWPPKQVADFLGFMRPMMDKAGLKDVALTPGETQNWYKFYYWNYADAIVNDPMALAGLGLITSHGFITHDYGRWITGYDSEGTETLRKAKPGLHAWTTSMSWGGMNTESIIQQFLNIYFADVNAIIPWAHIQRPTHWVGGDPNPGTAFRVREDGSYEVLPGYYFYKQVCRAGQPGMAVVKTRTRDSEISLIGFDGNGTEHPDAIVVINAGMTSDDRSDGVNIFFDVDERERYHFNFSDKTLSHGPDFDDVSYQFHKTTDGYQLEVAIPWSNLNRAPKEGAELNLDIHARDGENSNKGIRAWHATHHDDESLGTVTLGDPSEITKSESAVMPKTTTTPEINGRAGTAWRKTEKRDITNNIHPATDENYTAQWQGMWDEENLYLLIIVNDPTNWDARELALNLIGSEYTSFHAFRTTDDGERYKDLGSYQVKDGKILYHSPPNSVTTFYGEK